MSQDQGVPSAAWAGLHDVLSEHSPFCKALAAQEPGKTTDGERQMGKYKETMR